MSEELTSQIKKIVEESLNKVKDDLLKSIESNKRKNEDVADVVAKKLKDAEVPNFKQSYNKDQYEHNAKVNQALVETAECLERGDSNKAKEKIEQGKTLIKKRQKLILLADREEHGWEVAKCYVSDNLATDSEDEKRILRSRRQAASNKKRSNTNIRKTSNYENKDRTSYRGIAYQPKEVFGVRNLDKNCNVSKYDSRGCFICGEVGHFAVACPKRLRK
jgi:hypothetical protein